MNCLACNTEFEPASDNICPACGHNPDGLDIPDFLKRPRETPEQAAARRRRFANIAGPERKIKAPGDVAKKEWLPANLSPEAKEILRAERKRKEEATAARIKALKERVRR